MKGTTRTSHVHTRCVVARIPALCVVPSLLLFCFCFNLINFYMMDLRF